MGKTEEDKIGTEIIKRFYRAVLTELEEDRSNEVHVTDLVYECLRRAYYEKKYSAMPSDESGALVLWIGKKLHETPVCSGHEVELSADIDGVPVRGSIDELCTVGDKIVIVDKKSTRGAPSKPYEHHVKQVLFYAAILAKTKGIVADYGAVLYIDVANLYSKVFVFPITVMDIESAWAELSSKARKLWDAMVNDRVPPAEPGWLCKYCPYWRRCIGDGDGGED